MLHRNIHMGGVLVAVMIVLLLNACAPAEGEFQGNEYMPDMKHSIAYEANYYNYYSLNTWGTREAYHEKAQPRKPVEGTIPRGYAGISNERLMRGLVYEAKGHPSIELNGFVPYYYGDTEEERARAANEILENPFPITEEGLAIGEKLYNINCGICHGEKGDGLGYLVRDNGGKYPAAPANFLLDTFINSTPGRFYHSIMYGKNVMGAYKDKLSYKERYEVIHWIYALQAKDKGKKYSPEENTLNEFGVPVANVEGYDVELDVKEAGAEGSGMSDTEHGHDAEGGHSADTLKNESH